MKLGSIRVDRVSDMEHVALPTARGFPDLTQDMLRMHAQRLGPNFIDPDTLDLYIDFHTYVVRTGKRTILVDTCIGNDKERLKRPDWHHRQGNFLDKLAEVGVKPEDVDAVMCTHLHADHVGWNTKLVNGRWVPTFPNARYLMADVELRHLQSEVERLGAGANHNCYPDSVLPVIEHGQAEIVGLSHRVEAGVYTESAAGHTPGSILIHLEDAGDHGICTGDLIHHPVQLAYPAMRTSYCVDPEASARRRVAFIEQYADTDTRVLTAHFPAPSAGRIRRDGTAYRFEYDFN
jgi:glyoxylase-like metal-dependent hydrolase (beta-lactamase superfamily II)